MKLDLIMRVEGTKDSTIITDYAPVVLCKYCKHRDPEDGKCNRGHDILWQLPRGDYGYCADGVRKDDA